MTTLNSIIVANVIISLGSLIGAVTIGVKKEKLSSWLMTLVSLSAGALMGGAFLHLLPEAIESQGGEKPLITALTAFIGFFMIERGLHWRHCHKSDCKRHLLGQMNLIGDGVHNLIDGLVISGAFMTSNNLGIITTLAVALHEIPQEISDYGVLLYAGWSKQKALWANLTVALISVIGGIGGFFLAGKVEGVTVYLMAIAAGGFIYIAASDLMPELRKETNKNRSLRTIVGFLFGVGLMYSFKLWGLK